MKSVGIFGERNIRWYLGGQLLSLTGSMLQTGVLSLLIIQITGENNAAFWTGLVAAFNYMPAIILSPFAGIFLDRWDKKKILMITSAFGVIQSLALMYLTYTNKATIPQIGMLALLMGIVNAIDGPGRNVIVKDAALDKNNVRRAAKMFTSLYNVAQIAGPGSAGYLVRAYGYPFTFLLNALSFVALIVALAKMKLVAKTIGATSTLTERPRVWQLVIEGARYTFGESGLSICIMLTMLVAAFGFSYNTLLAIIARDMFGGDKITYSHFGAASGFGTLIGSLIIIAFDKKISHKFLVVLGMISLGANLLTLSLTHNINLAMLLLFLSGLSLMLSYSTLRSSTVHLVKENLSGVVMGFTFTFFYAGQVIGSFGGGYFANRWGCPAQIVLCGITLITVGIATPFLPGINILDKEIKPPG